MVIFILISSNSDQRSIVSLVQQAFLTVNIVHEKTNLVLPGSRVGLLDDILHKLLLHDVEPKFSLVSLKILVELGVELMYGPVELSIVV